MENWCAADQSTQWCRAGTQDSVRSLIEEFVEVDSRRLVLAALKHKIAREFVEGSEQPRPAIRCFRDEYDRIAEALHIHATTRDAILLRKPHSLATSGHKHLCLCDSVPRSRLLRLTAAFFDRSSHIATAPERYIPDDSYPSLSRQATPGIENLPDAIC